MYLIYSILVFISFTPYLHQENLKECISGKVLAPDRYLLVAVCEVEPAQLHNTVRCNSSELNVNLTNAKDCCQYGWARQAVLSIFISANKSCVICASYETESGEMNGAAVFFLDKSRTLEQALPAV